MNLLEYDRHIYQCVICMDQFENPVIGSDGMVYCDTCIIEWNKKNNFSPQIQANGDAVETKVTNPIKSTTVDEMCLITKIFSDLNLLKLIHNKNIVCDDIDDAIEIINMIDLENHCRINSSNKDQNIILSKIFSNQPLIKNVLHFINANNKSWKGIDGWTIPHYVIRYGECELIEFMLNSFNFDLNISNEKKFYPVHLAFGSSNSLYSHDQFKIIILMLKQNIDLEVLDCDGWAPLHYLCSNQHELNSQEQLEALRIIVSKNVNLEIPTPGQYYPIHQLCSDDNNLKYNDKVEAIKLLLDKNVNLEVRTDEDEWCPIHFISWSNVLNFENKEELFKIMVEKKVNFKVKTKEGVDTMDIIIESDLPPKEKSKLIKTFWF
jgi:ankyrin repeat protein